MTGHGEFATHHRNGEDVIKALDQRHPAGNAIARASESLGLTGMNTYLTTLQTAGITLPEHLCVASAHPLAVRYRWVDGPVLLDHVDLDPARFIDAVIEIAHWVCALDSTDARIDTNLANFCLARDQVVLIDVLPPLIPSLRPQPSTLFEVLFTALCFDTPVILDALIGYAARALLRCKAVVSPAQLDDLVGQRPRQSALRGGSAGGFPGMWFRTRAELAVRGLTGNAAPAVVHDFFARTSVRSFRDLTEPQRAQRIHQVEQIVTEDVLA